MKKIIMVAFIISVGNKTYAQLSENLASFNYGLAPIGHDDIDFYKTDFKFNIPTTLKKGVLTNSLGFNNYRFNYTTDFSFSTEAISNLYDISYGLKYQLPITKTWLLTTSAKAAIVSNLTNAATKNDLLFTGDVFVAKTLGNEENPETLTLGLSYTTITGKPSLLPTVSYTKQVTNKFSFGVGFPKTFANYTINAINAIQLVFLVDGFYANLNDKIRVNQTTNADKISFSSTSLALAYNYEMDDYWGISFKGGYAFSNKYKLLNSDDALVFNFNTTSKPFFSAGITFNLKK
ncbi:DUF6268 family outer membrane beta-barrel protein [Mariniflexile jejuense]|uniref:DUF6268 family outer membrane beta-barrel protein n=1 Tax=Mariniflexile jejuense TaxID=1173582 RepID=A0ABW3JF71_9FLAO